MTMDFLNASTLFSNLTGGLVALTVLWAFVIRPHQKRADKAERELMDARTAHASELKTLNDNAAHALKLANDHWERALKESTAALERARQKLDELDNARIVETLGKHDAAIEKTRSDLLTIREENGRATLQMMQKITDQFQQAVSIDAAGRRTLHNDIGELRQEIARLNERTATSNKNAETIASEVRELGKDVAAALARLEQP